MYINCHSYHSLRYGTLSLETLIQQAKACKADTLALTDINTVTGIYDFAKACNEEGIKPVVGMEFRMENRLLYIGLAKNHAGIGEICRLLTAYNCDGAELPIKAPDFENVYIVYPFSNRPAILNDNELIGIRTEELNILIQEQWHQHMEKMVVWSPVTVSVKNEHNLHRILRAIDKNVLLSQVTPDDYCRIDEVMKPKDELMQVFADFPQIISNTLKILEHCNFEFNYKAPKNKKHFTGSRESDIRLLTQLAMEGVRKKYSKDNSVALQRVGKELEVIHQLNFSGYFLITWDIVRYSTSLGLMHIGRGSGANSIIAYCLGITDI